MSVNNLQQTRHNRQEVIYNYPNMDYENAFAVWLEAKFQESNFKSYAALGDAAKLSRSTIAALAKKKPQTANNKPSLPRRENVILIAEALKTNVNEALWVAGYATENNFPLSFFTYDFGLLNEQQLNNIESFIKFQFEGVKTVKPKPDNRPLFGGTVNIQEEKTKKEAG